jgi:ubiquinone/menaquinone biosynthesis C-methylase UbiE
LADADGHAVLGESFDRAALEYDRARPSYPEGVLDVLPLGPDAEVLDLGAGTGKLTRVLAARYRHVVAVEPLDGMRGILERTLPDVVSLAGSAESIPLPDAAVDGVFAAQAFHWFANDVAVTEIARVVRPGGVLCIVWNESREPSPLPPDYHAYLERLHTPTLEAIRSGPRFEDLLARAFEPLRVTSVDHEQVQERENVLAFAASVSWIAHRPRDERHRIMDELDAMLPEGEYRFPMRAEIKWTRRTPG